MKSKAYNTTVVKEFTEPKTPIINLSNPEEFIPNVVKYHHKTNLSHSQKYYENRVANSRLGNFASKYFKDHSNCAYLNRKLDASEIVLLDNYIKAYFQDPCAFGAGPVLDMLHFTVDISENQISRMRQLVKTFPKSKLKLCVTGPTKQLSNNKEAFERYAKFRNGVGADITFYWGMKAGVRAKRPKHRLAKISLNPARFTRKELKEFFSWFAGVIGKNGSKVLAAANVTRLDIALDLVGVYLPYLLLDRPGNSVFNVHHNIVNGEKRAGTITLGCQKSSCTLAYDKTEKLLDAGPKHIPLLSYHYAHLPFQIVRIERRLKPADTSPFKLADMAKKAPFFLFKTDIYSPLLLGHLEDKDLQHIWKNSFTDWLNKVGQAKLGDGLLESYKLQINQRYLQSLQTKEIKSLLKVILNA